MQAIDSKNSNLKFQPKETNNAPTNQGEQVNILGFSFDEDGKLSEKAKQKLHEMSKDFPAVPLSNDSSFTQLAFSLNHKFPILNKFKKLSTPTRLIGLCTFMGGILATAQAAKKGFIAALLDLKSLFLFILGMGLSSVGQAMKPQHDKNTFDSLLKIVF